MSNKTVATAALSGILVATSSVAFAEGDQAQSQSTHDTQCSGTLVLNHFDERLNDGQVHINPAPEVILNAGCDRWGLSVNADRANPDDDGRLERAALTYGDDTYKVTLGQLGELRHYKTTFASPVGAPLSSMDVPFVSQKVDNPDATGVQVDKTLTLSDWAINTQTAVFADFDPEESPASALEARGNSQTPSLVLKGTAVNGALTLGAEGGWLHSDGQAREDFVSLFVRAQFKPTAHTTLGVGGQSVYTHNFANQAGVGKTLTNIHISGTVQPAGGPVTLYGIAGANMDTLADDVAHGEAGLRWTVVKGEHGKLFTYASTGVSTPLEGPEQTQHHNVVGARFVCDF